MIFLFFFVKTINAVWHLMRQFIRMHFPLSQGFRCEGDICCLIINNNVVWISLLSTKMTDFAAQFSHFGPLSSQRIISPIVSGEN